MRNIMQLPWKQQQQQQNILTSTDQKKVAFLFEIF